MSSPPKPRKGKGRKKIRIARLESEAQRRVAFSKRHVGLISKANELCTLTGAEVGIVCFSPSHKPYSFGQPSVNQIVDRYPNPFNLNYNRPPPVNQHAAGESSNSRYTRAANETEAVKEQGKELNQRIRETPEVKRLFDSGVELNQQTYEQICWAGHKFEETLDSYLQNRNAMNLSNSNFCVGASSSAIGQHDEQGTSKRNDNDRDISHGAGHGRGSS